MFVPNKNNNQVLDLKSIVSKRASITLWGNGYAIKKISGSDEDLKTLEEELDRVAFLSVMTDVERTLSKDINGRCGLIIDFDGNNKLRVSIANPNSLYTTDTAGNVIGATTYRIIQYGITNFQVMEDWNLQEGKKVLITNTGTGKLVSLYQYNSTVSPEFMISDEWVFGDEIPIILLQNLNSVGNASEADGANGEGLQDVLNEAFHNLNNEYKFKRSRLLVDKNDNATIRYLQRKGLTSYLENDSIIAVNTNNSLPNQSQKIQLGLQEASADYDQINQSIDWIIDKYLDISGYSGITDSEAQTTVVGTLYTNKKDMETTRAKKAIRESQLESVIALIIKLLKLNLDAKINIKANIMYDEQMKMDYIQHGIDFGVMYDDKLVELFYGEMDEEDRQAILQKIAEQRNSEIERTQSLMEPNEEEIDDDKEEKVVENERS